MKSQYLTHGRRPDAESTQPPETLLNSEVQSTLEDKVVRFAGAATWSPWRDQLSHSFSGGHWNYSHQVHCTDSVRQHLSLRHRPLEFDEIIAKQTVTATRRGWREKVWLLRWILQQNVGRQREGRWTEQNRDKGDQWSRAWCSGLIRRVNLSHVTLRGKQTGVIVHYEKWRIKELKK